MARSILAASLLIAFAATQQPALAENDVDRFPQDVGATLAAVPVETQEPVAVTAAASEGTELVAVPLPPVRPSALGTTKVASRAVKQAAAQEAEVEEEVQVTQAVAAETVSAAPAVPAHWQAVPAISQEVVAETTKSARIAVASRSGSAGIHALIAAHAAQQGVPASLADAVVRIESRYNPAARNGPYMGLTQIAHRTAQSLGYSGDAAGLLDPAVNLRYGMRYLAEAYKLAGGDTCRTVMKYQSGHRAVSMTAANRKYCAKVRTIVGSVN